MKLRALLLSLACLSASTQAWADVPGSLEALLEEAIVSTPSRSNETDTTAAQKRELKALLEAYASPEHHAAVAAFLGSASKSHPS